MLFTRQCALDIHVVGRSQDKYKIYYYKYLNYVKCYQSSAIEKNEKTSEEAMKSAIEIQRWPGL